MRTVRGRQYTSASGKAILPGGARRAPHHATPELLLVSAWPPEIDHLRRSLRRFAPATRRRVALGSIGIGLVEAAVGATRLIQTLRPRAVILVGTAGRYPSASVALAVGTAAVAEEVVLLPEILPGRNAYLPDKMPQRQQATPRLAKQICKAAGLPLVRVANPLGITASRRGAVFAADHSGCALENLEAFALARAAASLRIPFAVVLGVANQVGPAAHREWKANAATAARAACEAVLCLLQRGS